MTGGVIRLPGEFSKSAYLLILMLISVEFFHFTPIAAYCNGDICLILFLLWMAAGHFLYNPREQYWSIKIKFYYWPVLFVWGGVLISFFAARALYGQSFFTSFFTSRSMLAMFALPALGVVNPQVKDLEQSTLWFSVILLVFAVLDAVGIPILDRSAYLDEKELRPYIDEDSFVACLPGFHWLAMALFFYLDHLREGYTIRDLGIVLFLFAGIFLLQNRSMLFLCAIMSGYVLLTVRGGSRRQTFIIRGLVILVAVALIGITVPQWIKLFDETATNLGSDDYNRILAFNYFLFQASPEPIYYFTGMGLISSNTSSIMKDLMEAGIYNSDVGFIGLWNHYGVLPIVAVLIVVVRGLKRSAPLYVKFNALFILGSSLTLACFNTLDKLLWLCLFIYMVYQKPLLPKRETDQ